MNGTLQKLAAALGGAAALLSSGLAAAQAFPVKPIALRAQRIA